MLPRPGLESVKEVRISLEAALCWLCDLAHITSLSSQFLLYEMKIKIFTS